MLEALETNAARLTAGERDKLFGLNAAKFYGLPPPCRWQSRVAAPPLETRGASGATNDLNKPGSCTTTDVLRPARPAQVREAGAPAPPATGDVRNRLLTDVQFRCNLRS